MKKLFIGICAIVLLFACKTNTEYKTYLHNPDLFAGTVHELNTVVMGNNFPPMVAARNYTYAAIAAYEVIAAGDPTHYQSLAGQLNGLSKISLAPLTKDVDIELSSLLAYIKVGESVTFPEGSLQLYKDSILKMARDKGLPSDIEKASQTFADSISSSIIKWSKKDNYLEW